MKIVTSILALSWMLLGSLYGQDWMDLAPMPERVSNNAVTQVLVDDEWYVYSFSGIDSTKIWSGIHKKAYRYSVADDNWEIIDPLPSGNGRIAAGACTVKGKIYIIGGYEVFSNGNEISVDKVHIYDPTTDTYLPDGAPIPVPIDDHVQAVWRDSLIYVVTGWSNNNNVNDVQIYNPTTDEWLVGTSTPNSTNFKVFGGSGYIFGDTIYYIGGARFGADFPPTQYTRKGVINPDNPTEITWSDYLEPLALGYRMACASWNEETVIWIGGSDITYNYNGIAYNGSGGVPALSRYKLLGLPTLNITEAADPSIMPPLMDLRGVGQIGPTTYILAGGMESGQTVTNRTILLNIPPGIIDDVKEVETPTFEMTPNPVDELLLIEFEGAFEIQIMDLDGSLINSYTAIDQLSLETSAYPEGMYLIQLLTESGQQITQRLVVQH